MLYIYAFSNKISTYLIHLHNKVQKQERNHYEFINSSYLLMGLPGLAYLTGLCDVGWTEMPEVFQDIYPWLIHIMLRQEMHRIMVSLLWKCFTIVDWKNGTMKKVIWQIPVWPHRISIRHIWIILELHIKHCIFIEYLLWVVLTDLFYIFIPWWKTVKWNSCGAKIPGVERRHPQVYSVYKR